MLHAGTIEEKIYQRQLMKGELAGAMDAGGPKIGPAFTREELRELFALHSDTSCHTRDLLGPTSKAGLCALHL